MERHPCTDDGNELVFAYEHQVARRLLKVGCVLVAIVAVPVRLGWITSFGFQPWVPADWVEGLSSLLLFASCATLVLAPGAIGLRLSPRDLTIEHALTTHRIPIDAIRALDYPSAFSDWRGLDIEVGWRRHNVQLPRDWESNVAFQQVVDTLFERRPELLAALLSSELDPEAA